MIRTLRQSLVRHLPTAAAALCGVLLSAGVLLAGRPAAAQGQGPVERAAALVNEEVISMSDLMNRLQMAISSSGLPDTPETRQRLLPQVLRLLIDEVLQIQEARRLEIRVTEQDIDRALENLAQQNRLSLGEFQRLLDASGVPVASLRQQLLASVAWSRLVQRRIRPTVSVSDDEVQAQLERIKANAGKPEYLVSEIFLAVDDDANEAEVSRLADRLVEQIAGGANFGAVARQFSQSAGAFTGGDLGWLQQGQLEQALDTAVQQLQPGQFSRPIRGVNGYHILWLRDQRAVAAGNPADIQVAVGQLVLPADPANPAAGLEAARQIAQEAASCDALSAAAQRIPGAQQGQAALTRLGDLPPEISSIVGALGVGTPTQPFLTDRGIMILMVCDRVVPEGSIPPADQVRDAIAGERIEMLQRRYLRDLRRDATIEYRL